MSKETKTRILHLMALLGSIAAAVAPAWVDPEQTWPGRIAITIVVALLLSVGTERIKSQRNAILGGLALAGVVVAAILGKFSAGTAGFAFVGGLLAVISQVRTILVKELADGEQPAKVPSVPPAGTAVLILALGLGAAAPARADEWQTVSPGVYKSGSWVAHPNFAISAGQVNVKEALDSGMFSGRAIERVALAGGYGLTYHGEKLTMGAGLYFGTGISAKTPNAPQVNLLFTLWDALATGPGVQRVTFASGTVAWQMLWTVGLNYAAGGTVSKVAPWFDKVINACVAGAACAL